MPFVRIDALRADPVRLDALGRAVHDALVDAIGIPEDDLFQVLASHDGTSGKFRYDPDYLGVHRDDDLVFIDITLRSGRTAEQKQVLYRRVAELARAYAGTEPRNIFATLHENELVDWSFGEGVAQYAVGPAPRDSRRTALEESKRDLPPIRRVRSITASIRGTIALWIRVRRAVSPPAGREWRQSCRRRWTILAVPRAEWWSFPLIWHGPVIGASIWKTPLSDTCTTSQSSRRRSRVSTTQAG